jgi:hypothetical protein
MRRRLIALFATLVVVAGGAAALAQQLDYDEIAKRPGFTVTRETVNGEVPVTIRKATVTIHINKNGAMGVDQDTAVLCVWNEYTKLHIGADYCFPDSERELREDFADAVERFKDFIVANSLSPVSRSDLDAYVEKRRTDFLARVPKAEPGVPRCPRTDMFTDYRADGREKRRADVARILATPRPPVMNPCF